MYTIVFIKHRIVIYFSITISTNHSICKIVGLCRCLLWYKKTWIPTVVVPRIEALALPVSLEQQREAHAEYKYTLVLHS